METKLLIVSDLHLCRANRDDALAFISQLAGIADPQVFAGVIFAGDNYDGCRADGAEQELARMIVGACNGIPAYGVSGNHDPGDVPLFVLLPIRQLAVNPVDIAGVKVAGVDYAPAADMRQAIEQAADHGAQLIVTHAGFEGWWHRNAHLLVDDVPTNVPVVFGDIHQHHRLDVGDGSGPRISVGSAYPCDAGEAGAIRMAWSA